MARKRKPSFFKVLIGDFSDQLVNICDESIPHAFRKQFDGRIPQQFLLRTSAGTWPVDVKSLDNGRLFLQKGWKQFVQDNGLELGDFLIFRYGGNSKFYVDIYGRHGCQKEFVMAATRSDQRCPQKRQGEEIHRTNANSKHVGSSTKHPKQNMECENLEGYAGGYKTSQETIPVKSEPISDDELEISLDIDKSIRNTNTREIPASQPQVENRKQSNALEEANRYSSKHPCFRILLTETYASKGLLHIPITFVKDVKIRKRTAKLQVADRLWSVKWITDYRSSRFSQGWIDFVRDNDLKAGDACVFELVKQTDDIVMKVSFFRCS